MKPFSTAVIEYFELSEREKAIEWIMKEDEVSQLEVQTNNALL